MASSLSTDGAWGAAARDWAAVQEGMLRPLFAAVLDRVGVGAHTALLDVGCGTGLFCWLAAERGARVAGLDAAPGQLVVARERLPGRDFKQGDMEALPFASSTFDLVTCCNALQYASDPVQALREMRCVARPGATVGILAVSPHAPHASAVYAEILAAFRPATTSEAAPTSIARQPGALEAAMATAGLAIYDAADVSCPWDYPDLQTALRGILATAPAIRAIRAAGEAPVRAALSASLASYASPSGSLHFPNQMRYLLAHTP